MGDGEARRELATRIRALRRAAGYSQERLASQLGFQRAYLSQAESGRDVPSENLTDALDVALDAGGELRTLRERAWQERRTRRHHSPDPWRERGEAPTDRRQVLEAGALIAAADVAADVFHRIAAAEPDRLTLDELEADLDEVAATYATVPHAVAAPLIIGGWRQVEAALDGRTSASAHVRLTLLGGQFAYYLGRLAFNTGDMRSARRFATLAEHHAGEAGEPVLCASIAALRSGIYYWTGRYRSAVDHLRACEHGSHPYIAARMSAYEARAWAMLGERQAALDALDRMDATAGPFRPLPGDTPVGEAAVAMFRSGISAQLGDATEVSRWAPLAVASYSKVGPDYSAEEEMHARLTLAMGHLLGGHPDVDGAVAEGMTVLGVLERSPTHTVAAKMGRVIGTFTSAQRDTPLVRQFLEVAHVQALPAGRGA